MPHLFYTESQIAKVYSNYCTSYPTSYTLRHRLPRYPAITIPLFYTESQIAKVYSNYFIPLLFYTESQIAKV
jgi:hypothetical protein